MTRRALCLIAALALLWPSICFAQTVYTTNKSSGGSSSSVVNGFINGFTLSNDGTTPNSVLDIAAGYAADSTNASMITGTAFTKSTAGSWTAGSGNNGMGTGLTITASTWYHVFAIIKGGSFDVYFDTSATAANAPSGTTYFRYIGSFLTDASSHILAFSQQGQIFIWAAGIIEVNGGTRESTQTLTMSGIPPGFVTYPKMKLQLNGASAGDSACVAPVYLVANCGNNQSDGVVVAQVTSITNPSYVSTISNTTPAISYYLTSETGYILIITQEYTNPHVAPNF